MLLGKRHVPTVTSESSSSITQDRLITVLATVLGQSLKASLGKKRVNGWLGEGGFWKS